jgi:hypothetical protein
MTPESISDYFESNVAGSKPELIESFPNPYGMIPVAVFYDTKIPRTGFWNYSPRDLVTINEMYNLHLVDLTYASSWSIHQTLFTNCRLQGDTGSMETMTDVPYNSVLPRQTGGDGKALLAGLSKVIQLDTTGVDNPFVKYEGPDINLNAPTEMFNRWVSDYASDWSVRIKAAGEGVANSGFQLIVEEMDNLELRQTRARMFESGFRRMFQVIKTVWNTHHAGTFGDDSELFITFEQPSLPVDNKSQEEVWSMKIKEGRATNVDYFIKVEGLSKEEAIAKDKEIKESFINNNTLNDEA